MSISKKKDLKDHLRGKGSITVSQILVNAIKMQATSLNGRLKIAS